jgi:hypothetical protein
MARTVFKKWQFNKCLGHQSKRVVISSVCPLLYNSYIASYPFQNTISSSHESEFYDKLVRVMAQAVRRRPLTVEAMVRAQVCPCGISGS